MKPEDKTIGRPQETVSPHQYRQISIASSRLREMARELILQADTLDAVLCVYKRPRRKVELIIPWEEKHGTPKKRKRSPP